MEGNPKPRRFDLLAIGCLFGLVVTNFFHNMISSINAPLYPQQAEVRGLNAATYGLVVSFQRAVAMVSLILIGTQVMGVLKINSYKFTCVHIS